MYHGGEKKASTKNVTKMEGKIWMKHHRPGKYVVGQNLDPEDRAENLSFFIRVLLTRMKAKDKDLAVYLGVPKSRLESWLLKGRDIPAQYILPIAEFFSMDTSSLLVSNIDILNCYTPPEHGAAALLRRRED